MGSLDTSTPVPGPALADIPPCSTRELAVGLTDLFSKADGLTLPTLVIIYASTQGFSLQFAKSAASYRALAAWAQRFGAVLASENRDDPQGQPCRYVRDHLRLVRRRGPGVRLHPGHRDRQLRPA